MARRRIRCKICGQLSAEEYGLYILKKFICDECITDILESAIKEMQNDTKIKLMEQNKNNI